MVHTYEKDQLYRLLTHANWNNVIPSFAYQVEDDLKLDSTVLEHGKIATHMIHMGHRTAHGYSFPGGEVGSFD